jgi:pimeloyl-ACP methyl ester carboxylesterase
MGYPVIFVHGVGASSSTWKKFDVLDHPLFYISFSNRFAHPSTQVPELAGFINDVLQKTNQEKVILICHSMGGLVVRKYLADFKDSHRVAKLVLLSTPNLGSAGLSFSWLPILLIILGAITYQFVWPLLLSLAGMIWEVTSYLRGVNLLAPSAWSMQPNSKFLRELNSKEMPEDVIYISVLSDARAVPHRLVNLFLFREGGDGAVPLSSQKLSERCVPNFEKLNYSELQTNLPHFAIPFRIQSEIIISCIRN